MRLPKLTRKRIYQAKGQPVEITWPAGAIEPKMGHCYTVQSSAAAGEDRIVVLSRRELSTGWKVQVKLDADPVRPLPIGTRKAPEADPMGGPQFRTELEPEQVDARYQRLLDEEGRMKTVLQGARQRQLAKTIRKEQEIAEVRKRRKRSRRSERAVARHLRSARRRLDARGG